MSQTFGIHLFSYNKPGFQPPVVIKILSAGATGAGVIDEISTYYPLSAQEEHSAGIIDPLFQLNM